MLEKMCYRINPSLELGEKRSVEIRDNRICVKDYNKDRLLCYELDYSDKLAISLYLIESLVSNLSSKLDKLYINVKEYYKKIDNIINEARMSKIYEYVSQAIAEIELMQRQIDRYEKIIEDIIEEYHSIKEERDILMKVRGLLISTIEKRGLKIENEIFML